VHVAAALGPRLHRVTLISPGGLPSIRLGDPDYRKMPPSGASKSEEHEVVRHNLLQLMLHRPEAGDRQAVKIQRDNIRRTRFFGKRIRLHDTKERNLRRIRCPVQVMLGEFDTVLYPDHDARLAYMREMVADLEPVIIPGAGHWMQYENAETVNAELLDFLTRDTEQ
jgi:pimeloyl-ACP methyl ester carboxylesterase